MARLLSLIALLLTLVLPAHAQDSATLVSDSLQITGDTRLIADGNVEVFFKGRRLKASRIIFDQATDRLEITGPIVLTEETGEILILASQADLAADMSEGILTSARLVLNQLTRLSGRSTLTGRSSGWQACPSCISRACGCPTRL